MILINIGVGLARVVVIFLSLILWLLLMPVVAIASFGSKVTNKRSGFELFYERLDNHLFREKFKVLE